MTRFPCLLGLICLAAVGCAERDTAKTAKAPPPAKVEKLPVETEIARITLTPDAHRRLGITTAQVTTQNASRRRTFGGDVTVPTGKSIIVSAPFAGMIVSPDNGPIPSPGQRVRIGESVLSIAPLLTPERDVPTPAERVQMANARATIVSALTVAQGDVERTNAETEAARIAYDRAAKLLADRVGSARAADDATALLNVAQTNAAAAKQRADQLSQLAKSLDAPMGQDSDANSLTITAPQAGLIRNLSVTPGQTTTIGAPLFEIVSNDTIWIRVPVYVDLLSTIVTEAPAVIVGLDGRQTADERTANPIDAPPSADALSTTADLFYAMDNSDGSLRPGQRVGVVLQLHGEQQSRIVPAKSIIYDIYGGTWVYEQSAAFAFQRHRVLVRFTDDDRVVLSEGPTDGTTIVVDGAAELYGTEFGSGK